MKNVNLTKEYFRPTVFLIWEKLIKTPSEIPSINEKVEIRDTYGVVDLKLDVPFIINYKLSERTRTKLVIMSSVLIMNVPLNGWKKDTR